MKPSEEKKEKNLINIKRKGVAQKQSNDFSFHPKESKEQKKPFYEATKTAKVSEEVIVKINTLKPFIKLKENPDKTTMNDLILSVIDRYIESSLDDSEREKFRNVYELMSSYQDK